MNAINDKKTGRTVWNIGLAVTIAAMTALCGLPRSQAAAADERGGGTRGESAPTTQRSRIIEVSRRGFAAPVSKYEEASPELVKQYIQAVKDSRFYDFFKQMAPEAIGVKIAEFEKSKGVTIRLQTIQFALTLKNEKAVVILPDGRMARLHKENRGMGRRSGRGMREFREGRRRDMYSIHCWSEAAPSVKYRIQLHQLAELDFKCIQSVYVIDPANRPLGTFSVQNRDISSIVRELCDMGMLGYSFREDLAKNTYVSMKLHDTSIADCLKLAAMTAGWKASFYIGTHESDRIQNWYVHSLSLLFEMLRSADAGLPIESRLSSQKPLEDVEQKLLQKLNEVLSEKAKNRPILILSPTKATE